MAPFVGHPEIAEVDEKCTARTLVPTIVHEQIFTYTLKKVLFNILDAAAALP